MMDNQKMRKFALIYLVVMAILLGTLTFFTLNKPTITGFAVLNESNESITNENQSNNIIETMINESINKAQIIEGSIIENRSLINETLREKKEKQENPEPNTPPVWKSDIDELIIDGTTIINLNDYFFDKNNDTIGYAATTPENIAVEVNNNLVTIIPAGHNFNSTITFVASDGDKSTTKEVTLIVPERKIAINLEYKTDSIYDTNNDGIETTTGIIDLTVENTNFNWDVNEENLCTRWETYSVEDEESTIVCYGSSKCCQFIGLMATKPIWNEPFLSAYGQYGASFNNIVSAQVLYVDYELAVDEPFAEIYNSEWSDLSAVYYSAFSDFENICIDTCILTGFNDTSYTLIFEIEDAVLELDTLTYTLIETIDKVKVDLAVKDNKGKTSGKHKLYKDDVTITEELVDPDYYEIEITPEEGIINKLLIYNTNITEPLTANIGIDNVSRKIEIENVEVKKRYAIDASEIKFENATLTATAAANSLYKCKQWDFETEVCYGTWEKIKDLVAGEEYELTITKEDPGFIEGNLNITPTTESNITHYYYIGQWEWFTEGTQSYWRCPDGDCEGVIDLRSLPQMSKAGGIPEGYGFFSYPKEKIAPKLLYLGNNLTGLLQNKVSLQTSLGKTIEHTNVLDILWELLTVEADPTGMTFAKPLMPNINLNLELYLGGHSLVKSEKFDKTKHPFVLEVIKNDYRRIRQEDLKRGSNNYKKVLDALEEKYKIDYKNFIPEDLPDEGKLPHQTTITDNFNRPDNNTLGVSSEGWNWTEIAGDINIISNTARGMNSDQRNRGRANSNLSTDDHYAQALVDCTGPGTVTSCNPGVIVRKDDTTNLTHYAFRVEFVGDDLYINKLFNDVNTQLATVVYGLTPGTPVTAKGTIDGSSLDLLINAVSELTATDTAITGNLRVGIYGYTQAQSQARPVWDNFEGGDLAAADTTSPAGNLTTITNNSVYNSTKILIGSLWNETGDIRLYINFTLNQTELSVSAGTNFTFITNLSNGTYIVNATDTDSSNNIGETPFFLFTIANNTGVEAVADTTPPIINATLNNTAPFKNDFINFSANASDETGLSTINFTINFTTGLVKINYTVLGTDAQVSNATQITDSAGNVLNFTAYATDTSGNVKQNSTLITVANANPIIKLNNISVGNIDPSAAGAVAVRISFNVTDTNGISDINASKAVVNLTLGGLDGQFRANVSKQDTEFGTCYNHTQPGPGTEVARIIINCTVLLYFYDNASTWNITATVEDVSGGSARNNSIQFTYNSLASFSIRSAHPGEGANLNFTTLNIGASNQEAKAPIILNNSGNNDFDQINITAAALVGVSDNTKTIAATTFEVNHTNASTIDTPTNTRGLPLALTAVTIPARDQSAADKKENLTLWHGPSSTGATAPYTGPTITNGNQTLIFWIDVPSSGITSQTYNNTWNITVIDIN